MLILIRHQLITIKLMNRHHHLRIMNKQQQMELHQVQDKEQQRIPIQHHLMIILQKKQMLYGSKYTCMSLGLNRNLLF